MENTIKDLQWWAETALGQASKVISSSHANQVIWKDIWAPGKSYPEPSPFPQGILTELVTVQFRYFCTCLRSNTKTLLPITSVSSIIQHGKEKIYTVSTKDLLYHSAKKLYCLFGVFSSHLLSLLQPVSTTHHDFSLQVSLVWEYFSLLYFMWSF